VAVEPAESAERGSPTDGLGVDAAVPEGIGAGS
jgi:hypothetical protein